MPIKKKRRSTDTKALSFYLKLIGGIFGILVAITVIGSFFDDRYALAESNQEVHSAQIAAIQAIQSQLVINQGHMSQLFTRQQQQLKLNSLTDRKYRLKDMIKKYPTDNEIKNDYKIVVEQIRSLCVILEAPITVMGNVR